MPTAAAAALSRVDDKSAVRRQHGIDIHLRCRELGCAAAALDENASSVAINAERLTVRGDRARQQSKGGQNMQGQNMASCFGWMNRKALAAAILARPAQSSYQGGDNIANPRQQRMAKLNLSVAVGDYDRTRALIDGSVAIDGVDPVYMTLVPEEIFFRAFRAEEFDICELSLSSYTVKTAQNDCPYI